MPIQIRRYPVQPASDRDTHAPVRSLT